MSLIEKISDQAASLTPSERKLVEVVIDRPTETALGTAGELARTIGVHEATASRLARKLGFGSYAAFRDALREEFIATREAATRFQKTIDGTHPGSILGDLAATEAQALGRIDDHITPAQIDSAAATLMAARQLFVYGYGNAEVLALMMVKRFRRFGRGVHQLSANPRALAEEVSAFCAGDVLLTFAFRRPPRAYAALIETARECGVKCVVIAGRSGALLAPLPDLLLAAPRAGEPNAFQTLTVPMTVCNAIVIAAGQMSKEETLKKLDRLGSLIERFE